MQIQSLHDQSGRREPEVSTQDANRTQSLFMAMPQDDAPPLDSMLPFAHRGVLTLEDGMVNDALADGNVRVLVFDRDWRDPDDAVMFPGDRFAYGETFEATPEWTTPVVDPLRLSIAFKQGETMDMEPEEPARRRRRAL